MNRALRAATMGVLLFSPAALSACSAGQITQTATQERDKVGPSVDTGSLDLRQVLLEYPNDGEYEEGESAELLAAIANDANEADTLIGIEGDGFESVRVTGGSATGSSADAGTSPGAATGAGSGAAGAQDGEVVVPALVATPSRSLPRSEAFDFHEGEGQEAGRASNEVAGGGSGEDTSHGDTQGGTHGG